MAAKRAPRFDVKMFLAKIGAGRALVQCRRGERIFAQGAPADAVFFVQAGRVKLTVVSHRGKAAIVGLLGVGDFFGEGCLAGQPCRIASASAITDVALLRIEKPVMTQVLHQHPALAERFIVHLLSRNIRFEEDLIDQLFNSSEKRLERVLLLLAHFGKDGTQDAVVVQKLSQETLAELVGTTRPRISVHEQIPEPASSSTTAGRGCTVPLERRPERLSRRPGPARGPVRRSAPRLAGRPRWLSPDTHARDGVHGRAWGRAAARRPRGSSRAVVNGNTRECPPSGQIPSCAMWHLWISVGRFVTEGTHASG
jgi:CRP-like cAMP-binding protein